MLLRPKFRQYISIEEVSGYLEIFERLAIFVRDPAMPPSVTPDPGDDYLVALARASSANFLVSGDPHLTELEDVEPPVLTPRVFLDQWLQ